jgi:ABC-type multidrug transport system ATPase subunit
VLWDELTVKEHVTIWIAIKGVSKKESLDDLIDACVLSSKQNARAGTLSGGQKRKLQLACTLGGSTVCLVDEVSSGLVRSTTFLP